MGSLLLSLEIPGKIFNVFTSSAPVQIGEACWVDANSIVLKGVKIGHRSALAAGSVGDSGYRRRIYVSPLSIITVMMASKILWLESLALRRSKDTALGIFSLVRALKQMRNRVSATHLAAVISKIIYVLAQP